MGIAITNMRSQPEVSTTPVENSIKVPKSSTIKKLFKHIVGQWQGASLDRKWLWHAVDDSFKAYGVPMRVWRRHSALLVYARSNGSTVDPVGSRRQIVRNSHIQ